MGFLSSLDPTNVGAKTAADAVEIVEKVIQGWRLVIDSADGFYQSDGVTLNFSEFEEDGTTRVWKLRESTRSSPAVVLSPPRSPDIDPLEPSAEYRDFYDTHINRLTAVFMGTNGGMMNAFRADNGYELYGYIPHDFLPRLATLVQNLVAGANGIVNHQFFAASSPTVEDVFLQDAPSGNPEWRTVLAFGRGPGGKFFTALDITDIGEWGGTSSEDLPSGFQPPELLFTVGNNDGVVDLDGTGENYDALGETWSIPVMGRVQNGTPQGQWVLFAGSGYGCEGTEEGRFLYVLALEDGTVYRKLGPIPDLVDGAAGDVGVDQNALVATPALFNPHEPGLNDGRNFVTRVYIGDLQGLVHKLDCTDPDPANWEFGVFFEVTSDADVAPGEGSRDQPIAVQVAILKLSTTNEILIFVGTGGDSRVEREEPDRFKIVGIEDTDSVSTIAADDPAFTGDLIVTSTGELFFFDLEEAHRVEAAPVAARNTSTNGVIFFASTAPSFDLTSCTQTFSSLLTAVGVSGGLGSFDLDPALAGVQGTVDLGAGRTTGLFHRDEHLYVSKSGGLGFSNETMVLGSDTFPTPPAVSGNLQLLVETFRLSPF
ncbi:MAG TPA: PilC/PilY family type IV pilus protein [Vicinamibacteria bacterium]